MMIRIAIVASFLTAGGAAAAPGDLVDAVPIAGAPAGAKAWRIRYRSQDEAGRAITVTGAIVVPRGRAARERDIVVWAHGASGVAESCGLSDKPGLFAQIAGLDALLAAGHVVVAPDYQGLGNPGPHPFLVGTAAARSVIDAARAARAVRLARASARYAVFGESLGGFSALWTAAEAARAPELTLVGVAAAAPPTDLKSNLGGGSNALVRAFLTAYTASSWEQVYDLPLTSAVKPRTATLIRNLAKNCVSLDGFKLRTKIGMVRLAGQLRNVDLAASPRWGSIMARNSVPAARLDVPVFVYQGGKDEIVASAVTRAFVRRLCRTTAVRSVTAPAGDHISAGKAAAPAAVTWIGDRFAGKRPPNDCARL